MGRFLATSLRVAGFLLLASLTAHPQALTGQRTGGDFTRLTFTVPARPLVKLTKAPFYGRTTMSPRGMPTRTVEKQWRDSSGRLRTESNPQNGGLVYLDDPVAAFSYVLNPETHIAHRVAVSVVPYSPPDPGMLGGSIPNCNPPAVDRLFTRDFSGVTAVGTRQTILCPAGTYQNNDKPVQFISETWKSSSYNLTFITKNTNPESESTRSIEDFSASEPDPSLFHVPSDYKIVDENTTFTIATPSASRGSVANPPVPLPIQVTIHGPNFGGSITLQGQFLFTKGAPYSGAEAYARDRTLADGTHLSQDSQTSKVWRDSAGRVRTEQLNRMGVTTAIEIADPAGYRYVLDPWNHIAYRVRVTVQETAGLGRPGDLPLNDAAYPSTRTRPDGSTTVAEKLGTQTISGVTATGYRATTTGPRKIENGTDELWEYVPYHLWLVDKQTRNGNVSTQKVENFSPKEPDPALFKIPDGYRVVDETGPFEIKAPGRAN